MQFIMLMVYWILQRGHLKDVGLIQNWETIKLQNLTTLIAIYFVEGPT